MRTVIVEDHVLFRELFRKVCEVECGCTVVGETGTGRNAKRIIAATQPDLVVLDLRLPDGDGFEVAEFIRFRWPAMKVLMMSAHCDDYTLLQVERAGAQGFVDKNTQSIKSLTLAIQALQRGETWFSPAYEEARQARATDPANFAKVLSERECAVLSLIGSSLSDEEIALRLGITPATAQTHRSHIMHKLGIPGSARLIHFALEHGFTPLVTLRNGKPVLS